MRKKLFGWLHSLAVLYSCCSLLTTAIAQQPTAETVSQAIATIERVGTDARGSVDARLARNTLAQANADVLPRLLAAMDGENIVSANWLRTAFDSIVEREFRKPTPDLPLRQIEEFVRDSVHSGRPRRLALALLERLNPAMPTELMKNWLDDPEFRRDAVSEALSQGSNAKRDGQSNEARVYFERAFKHARQSDQVLAAVDQLKGVGIEVDPVSHLGFVHRWWIVGPFPAARLSGFGLELPPEKNVDLNAEYEGDEGRKLRWKVHQTADRLGETNLIVQLGAVKEAVGYAYAEIDSPKEQQIRLACSADDNLIVWLNGKKVLAREQWLNGTRLDRFNVPVTLVAGTNRVLVKICQGPQHVNPEVPNNWTFQLRFCDESGRAADFRNLVPLAMPAANKTSAIPYCNESSRSLARLCGSGLLDDEAERAASQNWNQWRGPNRNAVSAERGLPTHWSDQEHVQWKTKIPGAGVSSPIIWNDYIFLTASDGHAQDELILVGLETQSGRERWRTRLWGTAPTLHHASKSDMATPTPITDGEFVYALFGTGDAFCLDIRGELVWHRSLAQEYGAFENRFGHTSSPVLLDDLLILQCDHYGASYVLAIDKSSGKNRWKVDRPGIWHSWSSPQIHIEDGIETLIVCAAERMDGFDPRTGETRWTVHGMQRECIPTPVIGNGLIYAVSGPKGNVLAVRPGGRGDISDTHVLWRHSRGTPYVPSATLVGERYYLVDDQGIASCLDAYTGKQLWRQRFGGSFTASPVAGDGKIYFTNDDGETWVVKTDSDSYIELARNRLGEPVYASAAISQGYLFFRTPQHLIAIKK